MAQIDDFFMYENRVEGITDADYQRAQPYVEAAQAFAQTTYQSIYRVAVKDRHLGYSSRHTQVPVDYVPVCDYPSNYFSRPLILERMLRTEVRFTLRAVAMASSSK